MPEYSSTTLIPADSMQLPAMNGSSGGNFTLASLKSYILAELGQANGIATLDSNGQLTSAQIPDSLDDVLVYTAYANFPSTGEEGKLYVDQTNLISYIWIASDSAYSRIGLPLVQTVTSGDTTHAPSSDAVYNAILTEQTARENADSQLDKRVSNLEESLDVITEIKYPNATYGTGEVPPNKSKYAEVSVLKGVGRVANQLVKPNYQTTQTVNGVTFTNNGDGSWTVSGTAAANATLAITTNAKSSHIYLANNVGATNVKLGMIGYSATFTSSVGIIDVNAAQQFGLFVESGVTVNETIYPCITDLTVYFNGSIPTNAQTIDGIRQNYPELLIPSDYGTSVAFPTYNAVKSVGKNLAQINNFTQSTSYGQTIPCELRRGITYTVSGTASGGSTMRLLKSDGSYQYVAITATINATFVAEDDISEASFYGSITITDLQIEKGSAKTTYHPYMTDTLTLPEPVTLKGAGSVAEEYFPETGRVTHPLYRVNLGNLIYEAQNFGNGEHLFRASLPNGRYYKFVNNDQIANMICSRYIPNTYYNLYNTAIKGISYGYNAGRVIIIADSNYTLDSAGAAHLKADLANVYLDYEQENPDPDTYVDPLPDPFIQVEGGGTIKPVQTNDPEIDSAMTVAYTNKVTA